MRRLTVYRNLLVAALLLGSGGAALAVAVPLVTPDGSTAAVSPALVQTPASGSATVFKADFSTPGSYASGFTVESGQAVTVVRATTKTCSVSGTLTTTAANSLCVESSGALIEAATTNLALQSEALDSAPWGVVSIPTTTVTANAAVAPNGASTAEQISFPAVGAAQAAVVRQVISTSTSTTYTFSVWMKGAASSGTQYIYSYGVTSSTYLATTVCAYTAAAWTRCQVTIATGTNTSVSLAIGTDANAAAMSGGNAAQTIYVWGAQFEALPYASSYVPTAGTAVARNSDNISFSRPSAFSFMGAYCIKADMSTYAARALSSGYSAILGAGTPYANPNTAQMYVDSSTNWQYEIYDSAGSVKQERASSITGTSHTYANCVSGATTLSFLDGALQSSSSFGGGTGIMDANPATIYLGTLAGGGNIWTNGYLKNLKLCNSNVYARCK